MAVEPASITYDSPDWLRYLELECIAKFTSIRWTYFLRDAPRLQIRLAEERWMLHGSGITLQSISRSMYQYSPRVLKNTKTSRADSFSFSTLKHTLCLSLITRLKSRDALCKRPSRSFAPSISRPSPAETTPIVALQQQPDATCSNFCLSATP